MRSDKISFCTRGLCPLPSNPNLFIGSDYGAQTLRLFDMTDNCKFTRIQLSRAGADEMTGGFLSSNADRLCRAA